jgi:hypothetical protein
MKVGGVARQNDHAAGRIGLQLLGVELITQSDVKDAGDNCIDPVLWVPVRHQFHATGHFHPDCVRSLLKWLTNDNRETRRRWKCRERFPVDLFRQNCFKNGLARLMESRCVFRCGLEPLFFLAALLHAIAAIQRLHLAQESYC